MIRVRVEIFGVFYKICGPTREGKMVGQRGVTITTLYLNTNIYKKINNKVKTQGYLPFENMKNFIRESQ